MSLSILNIGCEEEDILLLREVAGTEKETPLIHSFADLRQAHEWASLHRPELLLIDVRRFEAKAVAFIRDIRRDPTCDDIPILAVVNEYRRDDRSVLIRAGATDIITAPMEPYECHARVLNLIELGAQRRQLRTLRRHGLPEARGDDWRVLEHDLMPLLANTHPFGGNTDGPIERMRRLSRAVAEELALPDAQCDLIEVAAPIHDIGNVGVPDTILSKPSVLNDTERNDMQAHTVIGFEMLKDKRAAHLQCAADIALSHHEHYDGTGYPQGLRGEQIPLSARIVAVTDVYDALISSRPYRSKFPPDQALHYLREQRGRHFDPQCVDALVHRLGKKEPL